MPSRNYHHHWQCSDDYSQCMNSLPAAPITPYQAYNYRPTITPPQTPSDVGSDASLVTIYRKFARKRSHTAFLQHANSSSHLHHIKMKLVADKAKPRQSQSTTTIVEPDYFEFEGDCESDTDENAEINRDPKNHHKSNCKNDSSTNSTNTEPTEENSEVQTGDDVLNWKITRVETPSAIVTNMSMTRSTPKKKHDEYHYEHEPSSTAYDFNPNGSYGHFCNFAPPTHFAHPYYYNNYNSYYHIPQVPPHPQPQAWNCGMGYY